MKVFISSVKEGLARERPAAYGIVQAMTHTPMRFEDFTAQNEPSREVCLRGVREADIYLLILGKYYGHRFPDSGLSPTDEEWEVATAEGKTRLVYRKEGVTFEDDQWQFIRKVGDYSDGVFYDTFSASDDLTTAIARKLRELEQRGSSLEFKSLAEPVSVEWLSDIDDSNQLGMMSSSPPFLELHVVPVPAVESLSGRTMADLKESLTGRIRRASFLDGSLGIKIESSDRDLKALFPLARRQFDEPLDYQFVGVRAAKSGQISIWATLPAAGLGSILDPIRLPEQLARMLRAIGSTELVTSEQVALGVGVYPENFVTVGSFDELRVRSSSISIPTKHTELRIPPDEAVTRSALGSGASEVATDLARRLIEQRRSQY